MMGMKKRMKRGGKAMKKRVKKKQGGMTKAPSVTRDARGPLKKGPSVTRDGRGPLKIKPGSKGAGTRDKPFKLSQVMNKKGTTYSGKLGDFMKKRNEPGGGEAAKKRLEKIRANRKGGGMMKKRMKRGGRAMKRGGGMMKKRMKRGGRAK